MHWRQILSFCFQGQIHWYQQATSDLYQAGLEIFHCCPKFWRIPECLGWNKAVIRRAEPEQLAVLHHRCLLGSCLGGTGFPGQWDFRIQCRWSYSTSHALKDLIQFVKTERVLEQTKNPKAYCSNWQRSFKHLINSSPDLHTQKWK